MKLVVIEKHENPVILTRQDWRGSSASWGVDGLGFWEVDIKDPGPYKIVFRFTSQDQVVTANLRIGSLNQSLEIDSGVVTATFESITLPIDDTRLEAELHLSAEKIIGVNYVDIELEK